jgi:hypothetical protein
MTLDTAIADAKAFLGHSKQELEIALDHLRNIIARYEGDNTPIPADAKPAPTEEAPAVEATEPKEEPAS